MEIGRFWGAIWQCHGAMLREYRRQRGIDELFQGMDRKAAVDNPPTMSPEEVVEVIHKMRGERRSPDTR